MSLKDRRSRERAGRRAEFIAAQYLRLKGFRILETRFRTKSGEIDLIACKKDLLIFVEVKARSDLQTARESVSYKSQKRIKATSRVFISRKKPYQNMGVRFDAVFILGGWRIVHEPGFFE